MKSRISNHMKIFLASLAIYFLALSGAHSTSLLPNAKQMFFNTDGTPCVGCSVYFYVPSTTTFKNTWQDSAKSSLNTNPVITDAAATAIIYGTGTYRQILKDASGNTIWDKITSDSTASGVIEFTGTSGGSANAQTVTTGVFSTTNGQSLAFYAGFSNTTSMTLASTGGSPIVVRKDTPSGPILLSGGEIKSGNLIVVYYDSVGGYFHLLNGLTAAQLQAANIFTADQLIQTSAGANLLLRNSTSPGVNGEGAGGLFYQGFNTASVNINSSTIVGTLPTATAGSESSSLAFQGYTSGAFSTKMFLGAGLTVGSPTGGDKGTGTINSTGLYVNGVLASNSFAVVATPSGGFVDLTGISAGVKSVTIGINQISRSGVSNILIQLGNGVSGVITTGYTSQSGALGAGGTSIATSTSGFLVNFNGAAAGNALIGTITLTNVSGNTWVISGTGMLQTVGYMVTTAGTITLGAALDRVRFTTSGGDSFIGGAFSLVYQ